MRDKGHTGSFTGFKICALTVDKGAGESPELILRLSPAPNSGMLCVLGQGLAAFSTSVSPRI